MRRLSLLIATAALIGLAGGVTTAEQEAWVIVLDARGNSVLGFAAQKEPYKPGMLPRVGEDLDGRTVVRDRQGRIISGFAYYGWTEGPKIRVLVLTKVPAAGAENRYYTTADESKLRLQEFATYRLAVGESQTIDEMKAIGLKPMTLRIEVRRR